jgi:diaminopimelate decarboxylase
MNDLIRPALYDAWHDLRPVDERRRGGPAETVDVVGPMCESGDFLARDRALPRTEEGDLLAEMSAGDRDRYTIVRRRETYGDLVAEETMP